MPAVICKLLCQLTASRLSGSGIDPDGQIASYRWRSVSGPKEFTYSSPTRASTTVSNLVKGVYNFELTVTDNSGATDKDTVVITVMAAPPNQSPKANAGADINITLPTNSTSLSGSGSDPDGTIASYKWSKVSGPSQYNIGSSTKAQTTVNNLIQGTYQFELTVTDNAGASSKDTMKVIVNAASTPINQPPTANAGSDINITLPTNSATLTGSGSDPDGTIASYKWAKISGPSQYNINSSTKAQASANNLVKGVYQFELTVTDNAGKSAKDTVQVTVSAAPNQAPTANAGLDINVTLPTNSINLLGSGSDVDGTIASYQWKKISGPSQYTIVSSNQAHTAVNNLAEGTYQFELTVTDNSGKSAKDTVQAIVNPASLSANH
jgi:ribosomal protein L14